MKFYFALIEIDETRLDHLSGPVFVQAMKDLKTVCDTMYENKLPLGKCTYHEVAKESEYRRVEKELIR